MSDINADNNSERDQKARAPAPIVEKPVRVKRAPLIATETPPISMEQMVAIGVANGLDPDFIRSL